MSANSSYVIVLNAEIYCIPILCRLIRRHNSSVTAWDVGIVKINRSGAEMRLTFEGRQTLAEIEQSKGHLMGALSTDGVRSILMDCTSVDEMDISFLQLLLSARKAGKARGLTVSLAAPATGHMADTLVRAGLARPGESGKGWFDSFWAGGQG